jgi:hypothetical protein
MRKLRTAGMLLSLLVILVPQLAAAQAPAAAPPPTAVPTVPSAAGQAMTTTAIAPSAQPAAPATTSAQPASATSSGQAQTPWAPPDRLFTYIVIAVVFLGILIFFANVRHVLGGPGGWSLADALSESTDVTDAEGKPVKQMRASSSRLIAFIGTIAIVFLFLGFGAFMLWGFAETGTVRGASEVGNYLLSGLTLFAPYAVNRVSSAIAPK